MNLTKRENVSFQTSKTLHRHVTSLFFKRHEPVYHTDNIFEVVKRKRTIHDSIPVATAFFILNHAKMHVQKFMFDIRQTIQPQFYRLLYMGKIFESK